MDIIERLKKAEEVIWYNPNYIEFNRINDELPISLDEVKEAEDRLKRFAPYIKKVFPEVVDGIIESPINSIDKMKDRMEKDFNKEISGRLLVKRDDLLPIAGSIKARGGIYEVLKHAETLAIENGLLRPDDDYRILDNDDFRNFFSNYTVQVGSTGNLGLSIGIMSAKVLVIVHVTDKRMEEELAPSMSTSCGIYLIILRL